MLHVCGGHTRTYKHTHNKRLRITYLAGPEHALVAITVVMATQGDVGSGSGGGGG